MNHLLPLLTISLISVTAFGHGEDKPGPHGGFIRMPGAFHTEVLPVKKNELKVYLLDINWKSSSVQNSSLTVSLKGKNPQKAKCEIKENEYYLCSFSKKLNFNSAGKLIVKAVREGQVGNKVFYDLPLKMQVIDDGHNGHH